jgi:hypothetical protein
MFFFTTNQLGFSPEFLGRIQLFAGVAELVGTLLLLASPSPPGSSRPSAFSGAPESGQVA